jgi:hypothetical protein
MADLVMGATPIVDPTPYRYQRFVGHKTSGAESEGYDETYSCREQT